MAEDEGVRQGRHAVWDLHVHLVFVTKYRRRVFAAEHLEALQEVMSSVCADFGCQLEEFNGEDNHVHLLVNFPPKVAISKLVNSLKGVSSRKLKLHFPELHKVAWKSDVLWSPSYFAGSVGGAPIEVLRQYIEQQNRPH